MLTTEAFVDQDVHPAVRGVLHRPEPSDPESGLSDGLILSHGAGSNCNAPLLVALAEAFTGAGFTVLRCNLPFRQSKPSGPPMGSAVLDQAGQKNAVLAMRKLVTGRVILGGHSYGGRQSTLLCASEPDLVAGLLLLSYPLHPPRKPEQLRTQHFPGCQTPALFVHGTRDPFGTIEEMQEAIKLIPARTELFKVEGAGHDLGIDSKKRNPGLVQSIVSSLSLFLLKGS